MTMNQLRRRVKPEAEKTWKYGQRTRKPYLSEWFKGYAAALDYILQITKP